MSILKYSVVTLLLSVPALAQTNATYLLTSSNTVSPSSPTTTIGIWAAWSDPFREFALNGLGYDLTAGDGEFSNPWSVFMGMPVGGGGFPWAGVVNGNVISGALAGQPNFGILPPKRDNPALLATYDWTTTDFSQRAVSLDTSNTTFFNVFNIGTGKIVNLLPDFTPGSGVINVVPAPGVWFTLALPLIAARRRRRC